MAENAGFATLQIIPSLKGIEGSLSGALGGVEAAGKKAGDSIGKGMVDGIDANKAAVAKAAEQVAKVRDKEADAADKVKVAEAQLQTLRDRGITDAGRLAGAEAKVEKAKRDHARASKATKDAVTAEEKAQAKLAEAEKKVEKATDGATSSGGRFSRMMRSMKTDVNATGEAAEKVKGKFSSLGSTITNGLGFSAGLGIAGIAKTLLDTGETFAQVNKTLSFATGATGDELDKLNESVKNIGKSSPKALTDIATAMGEVAKATQLTGEPLEDVTKRMIKLDTMGVQADIGSLTQAMRAFGTPATGMADQLDTLYRVSRDSGMGIQELSDLVNKGAPQFQQFGLTMDQTASLMGSLYQSGLRGEQVTIGLNKAMIGLAKGGGDAKQGLKDALTEIQSLIKSGNTSEATTMAGKLFGTKSAGQFIQALKSGKLNVDLMTAAIDKQKDGILDTGGGIVTMSGAWNMLKNNVMIQMEPIASKIFTKMTEAILWMRTEGVGILQDLGSTLAPLKPVAVALGDAFKGIGAALGAFGGWLGKNLPLVRDLAVATGALVLVWQAFVLQQKIAAAGGFLKWILEASRLTKVWAGIHGALVAVMNANPIMLTVLAIGALVAAVVIAYRNSETFRNIVQAAWKGIKTAISAVASWFTGTAWPAIKGVFTAIANVAIWLWQSVITPAFNAIKTVIGVWWTGVQAYFNVAMTAIRSLASVVMWLWNNVISPAFAGIGAVISWVWNSILKPAFDGWVLIFRNVIGPVISWLWNSVIKPAFKGIGAVISWVWNTIIKPIFDGWVLLFQTVIGPLISWLWNNVIKPAFKGIGQIISWAWNNVIKPAWDGIKLGIEVIGKVIKWVWEHVIKPAWDALGTGIKWVWEHVIKVAFNALKTGIEGVGSFFSKIAKGIGTAWGKIKEAAAVPIRFVVGTIWNKGIRAVWDKLDNFLPIPKAPPESSIGFAVGGAVPFGNGAKRGKDSVRAMLMPGEHVWDTDDVSRAGGQRTMYGMRERVMSGEPFAWSPTGGLGDLGEGAISKAFATGGEVSAGDRLAPSGGEGGLLPMGQLMKRLIHALWPAIKDIGGYRVDSFHEHDTGTTLDVMIPGSDKKMGDNVNAFAHANNKNYPLNWSIWQQKMWYPPNMRSEPMGDRGSPTQNHMDHVHAYWKNKNVDPSRVPEGMELKDFGGMSTEDKRSWLMKKVQEVVEKLLGGIKSAALGKFPGGADAISQVPKEFMTQGFSKILTKAKEVITSLKDIGKWYDLGKEAMKSVAKTLYKGAAAPVKWVGGLFRDQGGYIPKGMSLVRNETGKPEAVLNWEQLGQVKDLMDDGKTFADAVRSLNLPKTTEDEWKKTVAEGKGNQELEITASDSDVKKALTGKLGIEQTKSRALADLSTATKNTKTASKDAYDSQKERLKSDHDAQVDALKLQKKNKQIDADTYTARKKQLDDDYKQRKQTLADDYKNNNDGSSNDTKKQTIETAYKNALAQHDADQRGEKNNKDEGNKTTTGDGDEPSLSPEAEYQKSRADTISGLFGDAAKAAVEGQIQSLFGVLSIGDSPPLLAAYNQFESDQDEYRKMKKRQKEFETGTGEFENKTNTTTGDDSTDDTTGKPKTESPTGDPNAGVVTKSEKSSVPDRADDDDAPAGNASVKDKVKAAFKSLGWNVGAPWAATDWIVGKESGWNPVARNPSSRAFGLFQFLGSTKDQYLPDENPDPFVQGKAGRQYIKDRYGDPEKAKAFWELNGWYRDGGWVRGRGTRRSDSNLIAVSDGEFVMNADAADANAGALEAMNRGARLVPGPGRSGDTINYHIETARVPDAFALAQRQEKERALVKLGKYGG